MTLRDAAPVALLAAASIAVPWHASAASALWHGCVHAGERHGFFRAADGTRIAYAERGSGTGEIV